MARPNPSNIKKIHFADWASKLRVEIEPVLTLVGGASAHPSLISYRAEISADGQDWLNAGILKESGFFLDLSPIGRPPQVYLRITSLYDREEGDSVVASLSSPFEFSLERKPQGIYIRGSMYPYRGIVGSLDLLDDFREFAATNAAAYNRLNDLQTEFIAWRARNMADIQAIKQRLKIREDLQ